MNRIVVCVFAAIPSLLLTPFAMATIQPARFASADGSQVLRTWPWDRRGSGADLELSAQDGTILARATCPFAPRAAVVTKTGGFAIAGIEPRAEFDGWRLDVFDRTGRRLGSHAFEDRAITSLVVSDDDTTYALTLREPNEKGRSGYARRIVRVDAVCGETLGATDLVARLGFGREAVASLVALEPLADVPCFLAMLRTESGAKYQVIDVHGTLVGTIDALSDGLPEPVITTCVGIPWDSRGAAIARIGHDRDFDLRFRSPSRTATYRVRDVGPARRAVVETGSRPSTALGPGLARIVGRFDPDVEDATLVGVGFVPRDAKDAFEEMDRRLRSTLAAGNARESFVAPDGATWHRENDGSWTIRDPSGRPAGVVDRRADGGFIDVVRAIVATDSGIVVMDTGSGTIDAFDLRGEPLAHQRLPELQFSLAVLGDVLVLRAYESILLVDSATFAVRRVDAPDSFDCFVDRDRGEIVIEHENGFGRYRVP